MLIGITVSCVLLTALPFEARQYQQHKGRIRQLITSLGGSVEIVADASQPSPGANWLSERLGYVEPRETLWNVRLAGKSVSARDIARLSHCDWIVMLDLSETNLGNEALHEIAQLTNLRALRLANTAITDAGLAKLDSLRDLEVLDVAGTDVTYSGLAQLKNVISSNFQEQLAISRLRKAGIVIDLGNPSPPRRDQRRATQAVVADVRLQLDSLSNNLPIRRDAAGSIHLTPPLKLTDREIEDLSHLVSATNLDSSGIVFPAGGLEFIAKLENLESVALDDATTGNLTDDDVAWITSLRRLKRLELHSSHITGDCIEFLIGAFRLESLTLDGDRLNDDDLAPLGLMHTVQDLSIHGSNLTPALTSHLRGHKSLNRLELDLWYEGGGDRSLHQIPKEIIAAARDNMSNLAEIPNLRRLSIRGNLMVAEVLSPVTRLTLLEWLQVDARFVTHEEARALQEAMPHCHVQRSDFE
jgi:hypothetical protein